MYEGASVYDQPTLIGFELGAGQTTQEGSFTAPCGCTFSSGSGTDFIGSILYERRLSRVFSGGVKAGADSKRFLSSHIYVYPNPTQAMTSSGSTETFTNFSLQDNGEVTTTYVTLAPYLKYNVLGTLIFVQAAPELGVLAYSHFYQHRNNLSGTNSNGQNVTGLRYPSGISDTTLENNPLQDISTIRFSALLSAGIDLAIMGIAISPTITFDLPFSDVRPVNENGWRLSSLYGSVTFKFAP